MSDLVHQFFGVVESIEDPEQMNRVKVRIFGKHEKDTKLNVAEGKGIPTDDLPWSYVAMPTTGSGMHGFGQSPHGLVEGSWVWGISRDGELYNDLIVLAVLMGRPTIENPNPKDPQEPFFGRDGQWPDKEFLDEPDVERLARGELNWEDDRWKPVPEIKKEDQETAIPKIEGDWDEIIDGYGAEYPFNKVLFNGPTRTLLEIDETPGAERIHEWHGPSHTYREVQPDGSIQTRVEGDNYEIVVKDNNLYVKGEINITVIGNANILSTEGDINAQTDKGDISVLAKEGDINTTADKGDISIDAKEGDISIDAKEGDISLNSENGDIDIKSRFGDILVKSLFSDIDIRALKEIRLTAAKIKLKAAAISGF